MRFFKLFLAICYGSGMSYLVFFARRRRHLEERYLNLIPFRSTLHDFIKLDTTSAKDLYNFYTNLAGNIILFVPFPFVLASFFRIKDSKTMLVVSLGLTIAIEFIQYTFKIGVADIDDILLNMIGAAIGVGMLKLRESIRQPALQ